MDKLRHEFKEEIDGVKGTIKDVEKSLTSTQDDVESLKVTVKNVSDANTNSMKALNDRILKLEKKLKLETERNTQLEQYTRRENLRFNGGRRLQGFDLRYLTKRYEAGRFLDKVPRCPPRWEKSAGKNKADHSTFCKPQRQKRRMGETRQNQTI